MGHKYRDAVRGFGLWSFVALKDKTGVLGRNHGLKRPVLCPVLGLEAPVLGPGLGQQG